MAWSFAPGIPVYMQIVSRIRADILSGVWRADEQLPAVRQLAIEAGVNPNTMQRAFVILESEQLFVTRGTVGRFITTDETVLEHAREVMYRETVTRLVAEARAVGLSPDDLICRIRALETETTADVPPGDSPAPDQPKGV